MPSAKPKYMWYLSYSNYNKLDKNVAICVDINPKLRNNSRESDHLYSGVLGLFNSVGAPCFYCCPIQQLIDNNWEFVSKEEYESLI